MLPDISLCSDAQQEGIKIARERGFGSFSVGDFIYDVYRDKHGFRVDARNDSQSAGFIFTDERGDHYAFKVEKKFRSQGVGKTLFTTKQALDGILQHDWSGLYSRMFFLIKFGYMPLSRIGGVTRLSDDRPLNQEENRILLEDLSFYLQHQHNLPSWFGTCPFLIRMIYAPRGAQSLLEKIRGL